MPASKVIMTLYSMMLLLGLAACSGGGDTAAGGNSDTVIFSAVALSGDQEVPPVGTNGSGSAEVVVDRGNSQFSLTMTLSGEFTSAITRAHFHTGGVGENGGILVNICGEAGSPDCPQSPAIFTRSFTLADTPWATIAEAEAALADNVYINVHTVNNGPGEIRGQLGPALFNTSVTPLHTALRSPGDAFTVLPVGTDVVGADLIGVTVTLDTTATGFIWMSLNQAQSQLEYELELANPGLIEARLHTGINGPVVATLCSAVPCSGTVAVTPAVVNALMTGHAYVQVDLDGVLNNGVSEVSGQLNPAMTLADGQALWLVRAEDDPLTLPAIGTRVATLEAALVAAAEGDIIFVYADGENSVNVDELGITLQNGQKLIGEGVGLALGREEIVPAGAFPIIRNAGLSLETNVDGHLVDEGIPVVRLASGNKVAGFGIHAAMNYGVLANGSTGHTVASNIIINEHLPEADLNAAGLLTELGLEAVGPHAGVLLQHVRLQDGFSGRAHNVVANNAVLGFVTANILASNNEQEGVLAIGEAEMTGVLSLSGNAAMGIGVDPVDPAAREGLGVYVDLSERNTVNTDLVLRIMHNHIQDSPEQGIYFDVDGRPDPGVLDFVRLRSRVQGNTLQDNGQPDFWAEFNGVVAGADTLLFCLELRDNTAGDYQLDNNGDGLFQLFADGNTGAIVTDVGVTLVAEGTCLVP